MPIDNRRIQGPEISTPYSMFFADLPKTENTNQNEKNNYCKFIFILKIIILFNI